MYLIKTNTGKIQEVLQELSENVVQKEWERTWTFYHYTSLPKLFNILDNDCLWASNIRFSNDETEVKMLNDDRHDDYVVCFCKKNDQLSQWRGYCAEGGAAIGFHIGQYQQYSVLQADYDSSGAYMIYENAPMPVLYVEPRNSSTNIRNTELDACIEYINREHSDWNECKYLISPYIKNSLFYEELESRLAFMNKAEVLSKHIKFRNLDNGIKVPYIVVKHGDVKRMLTNCRTNPIDYDEKYLQDIYDHHKEIWVDEGRDQETIYYEILEKVTSFLTQNDYDEDAIKIFCRGHLPIDEIVVAPTVDRARVAEQIERFCRSKYWLKNVKVQESVIPYVK